MKKTLLIFSLVLICCSDGIPTSSIAIGKLPKDQMKFQKMIIGQLSGDQEINTTKNKKIVLKSRWNKKEREINVCLF